MNCKLRKANEEIEHLAKVAERERIARDLHEWGAIPILKVGGRITICGANSSSMTWRRRMCLRFCAATVCTRHRCCAASTRSWPNN